MRDPNIQLTKQVLGGNRGAFWKLLKHHYGPILRIANYLLRSAPRAEAITHQVCLDLPRWLRSYRGQCSFDVFLYQIVQNTCAGLSQGEDRYAVDISNSDTNQVRRIISARSPITVTKGSQDRTISAALSIFDKLDLSDDSNNLANRVNKILNEIKRTVTLKNFLTAVVLIICLATALVFVVKTVRDGQMIEDLSENITMARKHVERVMSELELLEKSLQDEDYSQYLSTESKEALLKVSKNYTGVRQFANRFSRADWWRLQSKIGKNDTTTSVNFIKTTKDEAVSLIFGGLSRESYSIVRLALNQNQLPQQHVVLSEEFINYFPYDYPAPNKAEETFRNSVSMSPSPWNSKNRLLHIGIKGYQPERKSKSSRANLVLLIDSSASMRKDAKLSLLTEAIKTLLGQLDPESSIALVAFGAGSNTVLSPTKVKLKEQILISLSEMDKDFHHENATGLEAAFRLAKKQFDPNCVNRIAIISDGDFRGEVNDNRKLKELLQKGESAGIFSSAIGLGIHFYRYELQQILERTGFENIAYADNTTELDKAFSELAQEPMPIIAKDPEIQVEFNRNTVSEYRLIGYETRLLAAEALGKNSKITPQTLAEPETSNIRAGYEFTALYEIKLVKDAPDSPPAVSEMPAAEQGKEIPKPPPIEYGHLKISYELPTADSKPPTDNSAGPAKRAELVTGINSNSDSKLLGDTSADSRFAAAVAAFAQLLRHDPYIGDYGFDEIIGLAEAAQGPDKFGYREEFIHLVKKAKQISLSSKTPVKTR